MAEHLRREIESLKKKVITMSAVVEENVAKATRSIRERSIDLANEVIRADVNIDQMEVDIEEECLKILALHQPVAIDLRFIIAVLKINSDLERVGDLAVNIAERSSFLASQPRICMPFDYEAMSTMVQQMLGDSIDALINLDTRLAHKVRAKDDEVDAMNREMYEMVKSEVAGGPEYINCLLHALSVGRHLERIADHATNIAEDVVYLVDAEIVRHTPEYFMD